MDQGPMHWPAVCRRVILVEHILVICSGTQGDVTPYLNVAEALVRGGRSVTLLANRRYQDECTRAGIEADFLDTEAESDAMLAALTQLDAVGTLRNFLQEHVIPRTLRAATIARARPGSESLHLVSIAFFGFASLLAEHLNARLSTLFEAPDHLRRWSAALTFVANFMRPELTRLCKELEIPPVTKPADLVRHPQRFLALWPDWFDNTSSPETVVRTGFPRRLTHPAQVTSTERRVVITHTSGASAHASRFFRIAIDACAHVGAPSLVVTQNKALLPDPLPPGCVHHGWFASLRVPLAQASAIIHHGGIGTTGEALAAGVPQLILPDGLDRDHNGCRAEAIGVGRSLPLTVCTESAVNEALTHLLHSDKVHGRCRHFAALMRSHDGPACAAALIANSALRLEGYFNL